MATLVFKVSGKVMSKIHQILIIPKGPDCPEFLFSKPVNFPIVVTRKSLTIFGAILWTIGKLRESPTMMVFSTFDVSANPTPKI
jgi:hypothetical protein